MLVQDVSDRVPTGDAAADAWQQLALRSGASVFQTPRFLARWHRHLGAGVDVRVRSYRRADELVGVVAEQVETDADGDRVLRFLGGTEVTDYLGPVAAPADREEVAAAWVRDLAADGDWDRAVLGGLAEDGGWHDLIALHAKRAGLDLHREDVDGVCPRIDLGDGYDAYLEELASRQRSEKRRKARKLARELGGTEVTEVPLGDPGALDTFFEMVAGAGGDKGRFFVDERMRGFFLALADEFGPDRVMRLHHLDVGGLPAAACVSLVTGDEWGLYNSAFDQALADHAPGLVLVGELIRLAAQEVAVFDFLRGEEPYKYRLGARGRTLRRLTLLRG